MKPTRLCCLVFALVAATRLDAQRLSPSGRAGAYMVYDAARGQTLLFGGWLRRGTSSDVVYPNDLWAWDGNSWRLLEPPPNTPRPIGRDVPVLAYDEARQRVVMFGGRGDGTGESPTWLTDVWEWDGTRWYKFTNTGMPPILHPMAGYDPVRRHVIVGGGAFLTATGGFARFARTLWEWDGAHWAARDTTAPENYFPGALSTTRNGAIIILGGPPGVNRDGPRAPSRSWIFNGSTWLGREEAPAFNNLQAVAGAPDGTLYMYQSWESWLTSPLMHVRDTSGTWRRIESSLNPGVRNTQALAWDARRSRLVLFGGATRDQRLLDDTWEFDGRDWTKR
jgi:hypothetical protein